ncbi:MAG: amidase [SAR202 cluster bacterium]|nr:amidase [SAR202 cluster bacterium]
MHDPELAYAPAWKQAKLVAQKKVSPVELVRLYLDRIEKIDPMIHAFITVASEQALQAARRAEAAVLKREMLKPLHGVPITLKDVEATKGIRTTLGSLVFKDRVTDFDSVVSERVQRSGAIIIGKTNTPEIAIHLETITDNLVAGACHNPWRLDRTTGGSSGGAAAALAAGLCPVAIGSDGGGSIRIPASFCGVYGYKPSHGRVPRAMGLARPDPNQFAQSGPMSNYVKDSAVLLQAISGPDPRDPQPFLRADPPDFVSALERPPKRLRIGWARDFGDGIVDPSVAETVASAARWFGEIGWSVEEAEVSLRPDLPEHFWNVFGANAYLQYGELLDDHAELLGVSARTALERGKAISGHAYARSLRVVNELKLYMGGLMERYDLLLSPTTSITAFDPASRPTEIGGKPVHSITGFYPYTFPINMTGQPAASIPCGFVDGLPVGLHIVGRTGDDMTVLQASAAFEAGRPWQGSRPQLAKAA